MSICSAPVSDRIDVLHRAYDFDSLNERAPPERIIVHESNRDHSRSRSEHLADEQLTSLASPHYEDACAVEGFPGP